MPHTDLSGELPEDARIDIDDESGLRHWADRLGTDPERLRAAVAAVGTDVRRVRDFLTGAPAAATASLLPDEDPHDANGPAGVPHYDIHKEAS